MTDPIVKFEAFFRQSFFNEPLLILLLSKSQKLAIRDQYSILNFSCQFILHLKFKMKQKRQTKQQKNMYDFSFERAPSWYAPNSLLRRKSCFEKLSFLLENLLRRMKQGRGPQ